MRYWIERLYPLVSATLVSSLFLRYHCFLNNVEKLIEKLVDSSLIVCGTLLGFLLTITTVISSIDTRRMRFIKDQGGFPLLMRYLKLSIFLNIAAVSMTIMAPFVYAFNHIDSFLSYIHTIQIFVVAWTWLTSIRFSILFVKVLADK